MVVKNLIGFSVVYLLVIYAIPIYLYKHTSLAIFLTYLSNVDIVSNILSISFPDYFGVVYNISPDTVVKYLSFNAISLVALSGIFFHGLKLIKKATFKQTFYSMIVMSIVTYTLPTVLIPMLVKYVDNYMKQYEWYTKDHDYFNVILAVILSLAFIIVEGFIISSFIVEE